MTPPGDRRDRREPLHRSARYYRVPARPRRWPAVAVWVLWLVVGAAAALAYGSYVFIDDTISIATPNTHRVQEARKIADPELPGQPLNILLIGSDSREGKAKGDYGRSDSVVLVRLDEQQGFISMLSFPRDSFVTIPGYGQHKLNAAYSLGEQNPNSSGPALLMQTVKQLTGQPIQYYVNVDFKGFARLVNQIGGVFIDVDRRYFNDNSQPGDHYEPIDLMPGYQLLNGDDALDFVRFRHTDSDFARIVRQQMFLSELKRKVKSRVSNWVQSPGFVRMLAHNIETDIGGRKLLDVIRTGIETPDSRVFRKTLDGATQDMGSEGNVVILDPTDVAQGVQEWLNPQFEGTVAPKVDPTRIDVRVLNGSGRTLVAEEMADLLRAKGYRAVAAGNARDFSYTRSTVYFDGSTQAGVSAGLAVKALIGPNAGLASLKRDETGGAQVVVVVGTDFAGSLYTAPKSSSRPKPVVDVIGTTSLVDKFRRISRQTGVPLMVPTRLARGSEVVDVRVYRINTGGSGPLAVKVVLRLPDSGGLPRYWGIMATTMKDPPILLGKTGDLRKGDGLVPLTTYYNGKILVRDAFARDGVTYWVSNTINKRDYMTSETIHSIARSFRPVGQAKLPRGVANTPVAIGDDPSTP